MFSYNDGKLHEQVELLGDFDPIKLTRIGYTTQYVAPSAAIHELRETLTTYRYRVDGVTLPTQLFNRTKHKATKKLWEGTPYLHVKPVETPSVLIYVIPGNPGVCEYYYEFVEALARLVPGSEVAAVSYLGYNLDGEARKAGIIGLDEQIDHKIEFLDFLLSDRTLRPNQVIVLGHSVGSWIAQRVALRSDSVTAVGLLTPTIKNIALSDRGAVFTKTVQRMGPQIFYYAIKALSITPFSSYALSILIGQIMPKDKVGEEAREASIKLARNASVVRQIIGMAIEEMQRIGDEVEPREIVGFWDKYPIWGCFAKEDHWVSKDTQESLFEFARSKPNVRMISASVPHAFCLRDSEAIAGLSAQQIDNWINK